MGHSIKDIRKGTKALRIAAALISAVYAGSACGPSLLSLVPPRTEEALAGPACGITPGAGCMCPLEKSQAGNCCCKHKDEESHGTGTADPAEDCAKIGVCGSHAPAALAGPVNLAPHLPAPRAMPLPQVEDPLLAVSATRVLSRPPEPREKVPI